MRRRNFCISALAAALSAPIPLRTWSDGTGTRIKSGVDAVTLDGAAVTLPPAAVRELADSLLGDVLLAGMPGYQRARSIWNGMFDRHPALIVQCAGPADVVNAVTFARDYRLLLAVRSGGHSIAGKSVCEGGLMIDMTRMNGVRVDPRARTVRVEGGALLAAVDHETLPLGLATTFGTVSHTGAAGLTLGGGIGRLARLYGLASDNLLGADVVTADGRYLSASAGNHSDLFWGLRGGGGNFGVVTSLEYRLHPFANEVLGGTLLYPVDQARDVFRFVSDFARQAHREVSLSTNLITTSAGRAFASVSVCYLGDMARGEKHLAPLLNFGSPARSTVGRTTYSALQTSNDRLLAPGRKYYLKSGYVNDISPEFIDGLIERAEASPRREIAIVLTQLGGAIQDLPDDATAYAHRYGEFDLMIGAAWDDPAYSNENVAWGREAFAAIEPFTRGFYVNSLMDESNPAVHRNYLQNYPRLVALKNAYDPENLFRLNANIAPSA